MRSQYWGPRLYAQDKNVTVRLTMEPFDKGVFSHGSGSAYPPDRSQAIFPSVLSLQWSDSSLDDTMASALRQMANSIHNIALAEKQDVSNAAVYVNYALFDTPLQDMYGGNVDRLHNIKEAIDPDNVMGLTGGWRF